MNAATKRRATTAYIWVAASIPMLTLIICLATIGTGDYRDPLNP